jgi:hypothetical protein
MEKERIKQIVQFAEEFCDDQKFMSNESRGAFMVYTPKFAASLIEKGVFVEAEKLPLSNISAVKKIDNIRNNVPVVGKGSENWYKSYANALRKNGLIITEATTAKQPTVSSAGKEVKTAEEYIRDIYGDRNMLRTVATLDIPSIQTLMEDYSDYCNQFKATPAKEISDDMAEEEAIRLSKKSQILSSHRFDEFSVLHGAMSMYKWYQSQLKAKQ